MSVAVSFVEPVVFPFHENAYSISWTIFKAFCVLKFDFTGDVNRTWQPVKTNNKFPSTNALFIRTLYICLVE